MILVDSDTPSSPLKHQQPLADASAAMESTSGPPPAYQNVPKPTPVHQNASDIPRGFAGARPESAGRRFFNALGIALLIWLLFGVFTETAIEVGTMRRQPVRAIPVWTRPAGDRVLCHGGFGDWVNGVSNSHIGFDLPVDAQTLFVTSTGVLAHGDIHLVQVSDPQQTSVKVDIEILVEDAAREALDSIHVCSLERDGGQKGITIFTPEHWPGWHPRVRFNIVVQFPKPSHPALLPISAFETDLPIFEHHVGELQGNVAFDRIHLKSSNAKISAGSLEASSLSVQTSNGAIEGVYHSSSRLELITSNAHITASTYLYHSTHRYNATSLVMRTSNARLFAPIFLSTTAASHTGGLFDIGARTSNGALDVDVSAIPPDARVQLRAETSNARAGVTLVRAFEGAFELHTSNAAPDVQYTSGAPDPAGRGRTRHVTFGRAKAVVRGSVRWGDEEGGGDVFVKTSNAPLQLTLP
ncbi:hypothetical protein B0H21DRAFT_765961 [Amylocystis lapponica]|nr:hypothetical protein B0H21DRAFT_765961 [Amylocystis lapponica]